MVVARELPGTLPRRTYTKETKMVAGDYGPTRTEVRTYGSVEVSELVSSELELVGKHIGLHAPVLDLDVPAFLVPSSTKGHSHLYIDVPMSWRKYKRLLKMLAKYGILEQGYVDASIARRHTAVRLPWVKKSLS